MRRFIALVLLMCFLVACGQEAPVAPTPSGNAPTSQANAPTGQGIAPTTGAYPKPGANSAAYPAPQQSDSYPDPNVPQGPKFTIKEPVTESDQQVTGTGPAGLLIKLIDKTAAGDTLAQTTIDANGNFTFDVAGKLVKGHGIGLKLGDGAGVDPNNYVTGPGYQDVPFLGVIFAATEVR